MGTWLEQPSPSDFDRWEALLITGVEPSTAAKELGYTSSQFKRSDRERHAAALELSREARGHYADEKAEEWALDPEADHRMRELWLKRWNAAFADRTNIDLSGGMEVTSPDVAAAIERFTTRVLSLATGQGEGGAGGDAAGLGEGGARVPVAQLDRAPEPGATGE